MISCIVIITSTAFPLKAYMSTKNDEWAENDKSNRHAFLYSSNSFKNTATQTNFYACWQSDRRAFLYIFERGYSTKKKYLWRSLFVSFSEGNITSIWLVYDITFLTLTSTPSEWENGYNRERKANVYVLIMASWYYDFTIPVICTPSSTGTLFVHISSLFQWTKSLWYLFLCD